MKLRMEESDTVFEIDDIEPFPRTIADSLLRMLAVAEAANPAIDKHEVLLELEYVRRSLDRKCSGVIHVPATQVQDLFEDLRPNCPSNPPATTKGPAEPHEGHF